MLVIADNTPLRYLIEGVSELLIPCQTDLPPPHFRGSL